ncbi:MAG: hemolysin family protein [Planctomycetaceae bacterium]
MSRNSTSAAPGRIPQESPVRFTSLHAAAALPLLAAPQLLAWTPAAYFWLGSLSLLAGFLFALFENTLTHLAAVRLLEEARRQDLEERLKSILGREDETIFLSKLGRGISQLAGVVALVVGLFEAQPPGTVVVIASILFAAVFPLVFVGLPYILALRGGVGFLLRGILFYDRAVGPIRPLARLLHRTTLRLVRPSRAVDPSEELKDEILSAVEEGRREGLLEDAERKMIEGVIDLSAVTAEAIMTPRTEMICVPIDTSGEEAARLAVDHGLSRLPVYRGSRDDIAGMFYVRDLLPYWLRREPPPTVAKVMRQPMFVPSSKNIQDVLHDMRARQVHLAIVLDEYGGTAGVVSLEDILEEIVGEIGDEHERAGGDDEMRIDDDGATVRAGTTIETLNRALGLEVPESDAYETIGGLLLSRLGKIPAKGEQVDLEGVRFLVLEADERRIHRVKVTVEGTHPGAATRSGQGA